MANPPEKKIDEPVDPGKVITSPNLVREAYGDFSKTLEAEDNSSAFTSHLPQSQSEIDTRGSQTRSDSAKPEPGAVVVHLKKKPKHNDSKSAS